MTSLTTLTTCWHFSLLSWLFSKYLFSQVSRWTWSFNALESLPRSLFLSLTLPAFLFLSSLFSLAFSFTSLFSHLTLSLRLTYFSHSFSLYLFLLLFLLSFLSHFLSLHSLLLSLTFSTCNPTRSLVSFFVLQVITVFAPLGFILSERSTYSTFL